MKYLDTNIWIYAIMAHPKYGEKCMQILEDLEKGALEAVISVQVLSEVANVLYRRFGIRDTVNHVGAILSYPLKVIDLTPDIVLRAAEYSRDYGILPYDGIHVASALSSFVTEILSADKELDKVGIVKRIDPLEFSPAEK
jgi:predicted nucleic acid-binding protein